MTIERVDIVKNFTQIFMQTKIMQIPVTITNKVAQRNVADLLTSSSRSFQLPLSSCQ